MGRLGSLTKMYLEPKVKRRERGAKRKRKGKIWGRNGGDFVFLNFWKCGLGAVFAGL